MAMCMCVCKIYMNIISKYMEILNSRNFSFIFYFIVFSYIILHNIIPFNIYIYIFIIIMLFYEN